MLRTLLTLCCAWLAATGAAAEVVNDWNERAVAFVAARTMAPPRGGRILAMVHGAMFDAVNSIQPRYRPYLGKLPATGGESIDAAAAAAAAGVLAGLDPAAAAETRAGLDDYLAKLPAGESIAAGRRLGEAAATAMLAARADDGSDAPDDYVPATPSGVYVPTDSVAVPHWGRVKPFAVDGVARYRPGPPPSLASATWRRDLDEIHRLGGRDSRARSARQTEDGRFWLTRGPQAYFQVVRQFAAARKLEGVEAARYMALVGFASADAIAAVFEAKYHYGLWRPVTAIRRTFPGSRSWQPLEATPLHPEYPCAHCINAAVVASVTTAALGDTGLGEFSASSPTAPGITHRWRDLGAFVREVSEARIWSGFHYRFSTEVANDMGRAIGADVARAVLQPLPEGQVQ